MSDRPRLSIVVPVHNEVDNIPELYGRLTAVLAEAGVTYEIIVVNDGSTDGSLAVLRDLHAANPRVKVVSLARNFGHQIAISAGLDHACGEGIVMMDADLQDPPEVIPAFIAKWQEGYQVVYGKRRQRQEHVFKRAAYALFYRVLAHMSAVEIPLDAGDFSLIDARVADVMRSMPERSRFVRGLRSWVGFRQIGVEYPRSSRHSGRPKYTFSTLIKLAFDGLLSFSMLPLRVAVYMGLSIAALSFLAASYYLWGRLMSDRTIPGFATTIIVVLFLGGIQLVTLGIVGEYVGRMYEEVKARPLYVIGDTIGIEP
ncbi:MAG TPA: glycosyltransferase family 2 protein [Vicinamibacterales bacterium]|nr:glycosyltransferase family 2 protein [Vicinamibacterales bacterium]